MELTLTGEVVTLQRNTSDPEHVIVSIRPHEMPEPVKWVTLSVLTGQAAAFLPGTKVTVTIKVVE